MANSAFRKRRPRIAQNNPSNPNYRKLREKLARKRERRQLKRLSQNKKPIALPLEMIEGKLQRRAYGRGNLLLKDGKQLVSVPLVTRPNGGLAFLQGVYKTGEGEYAILRATTLDNCPTLQYFIRKEKEETHEISFFDRIDDIAHDLLDSPELNNRGLGVRAAAKAEKEYRAIGGKQPIIVDPNLTRLFSKLHYVPHKGNSYFLEKYGPTYTRDDMRRNHVIEAIDPITGRIRTYTFHIKRRKN